MKRLCISNITTNRILNLLLWLCFCGLSGIGFLLAFRLPPGSRGGSGLSALGMTRHQWGDLHTWLGYTLVVLALAHLALHWRWLWQAASRKRSLWLLGGLGAGLTLALALALQPIS